MRTFGNNMRTVRTTFTMEVLQVTMVCKVRYKLKLLTESEIVMN